jgi:hypothetical protein
MVAKAGERKKKRVLGRRKYLVRMELEGEFAVGLLKLGVGAVGIDFKSLVEFGFLGHDVCYYMLLKRRKKTTRTKRRQRRGGRGRESGEGA